ncbi:hypothetical protein ACLOJK_036391, partial [Asimina triloba]
MITLLQYLPPLQYQPPLQCSRQPQLEQCSRQPPLEQCSRHATVMPPATVTASYYSTCY